MESKEALEHFVMYLQTINRHLRSQMFDQQETSLTRVQWLLMRNLYRNGASTIGKLAEHLDVRSSTMSQMVDRLEKAGFAYRESSEPDARVRWVKLTEEGKRVIRQTEALWAQTLSEPFEQFSEVERQQFLEYMHRLSEALPTKKT